MAREGLFNVLTNQYQLSGLKVIDLFAGSGGISYEFASRGAQKVICVEKSFPVFKHLIKGVNELGLDAIHVIKKDAITWIKNSNEQADIVFADPPFDHPSVSKLPEIILNSSILLSGGCFILEHGEGFSFEEIEEYRFTKSYRSVHFSFFFVD
jgi:16S rRNA (guanine(966)-N(2))-methyltransferase RsmD